MKFSPTYLYVRNSGHNNGKEELPTVSSISYSGSGNISSKNLLQCQQQRHTQLPQGELVQ
jgi:hypothetical protein